MATTAFIAKTLYTPDPIENGILVIEDDRILKVGPRSDLEMPLNAREVRVDEGLVAPGFVDTHNHGGGGRDVMEATAEAFEIICRTLARFGTTSFYPTTMTAPTSEIRRSVEFLAAAIEKAEKNPAPMTQPLGIHMEGPYLNKKRRGAHPPEYLVEPTIDAYQMFAGAARGYLRIMTIAPELSHSQEVIEEMVHTGVHPSIGHTDATFDDAERAAQLGARQATHMFNAMRPFSHRDPGVIAKVLSDTGIKAELIADGVHVDPQAIRMLYQAKGADGIFLISDGISAVGMPDGEYSVGGLRVMVEGGVCRSEGRLAGSVLTLDCAVQNVRDWLGLSRAEAIRMATLNTARVMGVDDRKGCFKPGADADLVIMDDNLQLRQVYARGQFVA